jgi:histidinol-phosphate aminotransferase
MAEHGLASAVKLASNEVPFGPLPGVSEAVARATVGAGLYPDPVASRLRDALADRHGRRPDEVAVGPGTVGLLQQLLMSYAGSEREVVFPWPSFIAYPQFTLLAGATIREASLTDWTTDVDEVLATIGPRSGVVLVANPNNPTSTAVRAADLARLIDGIPPDVLVVIDEAYHEFVTDPEVPDALVTYGDRANVVVLRTFSKAWGLAALRVGYLVAHPDVVSAVDATLTPFVVSAPAQAAALAALEQGAEVERRAAIVVRERARVTEALSSRGLAVLDSQANFVWLPVGVAARRLAAAMERRGVVTRPFAAGIRVTIGLPEENDRFLSSLDAALAEVTGARWPAPARSVAAAS